MKNFKWVLILAAVCFVGILPTTAQSDEPDDPEDACGEALTISNANGLVSYRPWTFDPFPTNDDPNGLVPILTMYRLLKYMNVKRHISI